MTEVKTLIGILNWEVEYVCKNSLVRKIGKEIVEPYTHLQFYFAHPLHTKAFIEKKAGRLNKWGCF